MYIYIVLLIYSLYTLISIVPVFSNLFICIGKFVVFSFVVSFVTVCFPIPAGEYVGILTQYGVTRDRCQVDSDTSFCGMQIYY